MKKIYILILSLSFGISGSAQNSSNTDLITKSDNSIHKIKPSNTPSNSKGVVLWSNEFDNSADWVLDNSCNYAGLNIVGGYDYVAGTPTPVLSSCSGVGTVAIDPNTGAAANWRFETDPNLIPVGVLAPFASASASNGYLFINSDAIGGGDNDGTPIFVTATIGTPIDLSNESSVVLSFSHNYRWWQDTRGVRVSGDNGTTWSMYELTNNSGYQNDQNSGNPEVTSIDISSIAGNQSQVLVQFYYEDNDYWAWYWAVDDVKISRKDQHNVENQASWIYSESTNFAEYGRTPMAQMDNNWVIGAQVTNDGVAGQTNVTLNADFGSFSVTAILADTLEGDSTRTVETTDDLSSYLTSPGVFQGTYTVSSDSDQVGGLNFGDNVLERNFEITTDIYSLDGIGSHPAGLESLASYGSYSWPADASDGLVCATMYPFKNNDTINSVRANITSTTVENAEVILYIIDSLEFAAGNFGNSIYTSDLYTVSATDVANGFIEISVEVGNESLAIQPGNYYAALELYSGGNTFDIGIIDDATVGQPGWSSAIWYPADQAYSNGNAFAIRLNLGNVINTSGISELKDEISIYPNPSNGIVNVTFENNKTREITVRDISGKVILNEKINSNTEIDFNKFGKGIYLLDINSDTHIVTEKVTIQ
jgi:hypothetical protein